MSQVRRAVVVEVCAELAGEPLREVGGQGVIELRRGSDGKKICSMPVYKELTSQAAEEIIKKVARDNSEMYKRGKKLLFNKQMRH